MNTKPHGSVYYVLLLQDEVLYVMYLIFYGSLFEGLFWDSNFVDKELLVGLINLFVVNVKK